PRGGRVGGRGAATRGTRLFKTKRSPLNNRCTGSTEDRTTGTTDRAPTETYSTAIAIRWVWFVQAEDGIRDWSVTGVQTCALPISSARWIGTDADRTGRDAHVRPRPSR